MHTIRATILTVSLLAQVIPADAAGKTNDDYSVAYNKCMSTGDAGNGLTSAILSCTVAELKIQDAKLNTAYKALMASLEPEQRGKVISAQRLWVSFKTANCASKAQSGGTIDQIVGPDCVFEMTVLRTKELSDMKDQ